MSKYVTREIEKPYVVKARTIDVSGAIDKAVRNLAPTYGQTDELRSDLTGALEAEILESGEAVRRGRSSRLRRPPPRGSNTF